MPFLTWERESTWSGKREASKTVSCLTLPVSMTSVGPLGKENFLDCSSSGPRLPSGSSSSSISQLLFPTCGVHLPRASAWHSVPTLSYGQQEEMGRRQAEANDRPSVDCSLHSLNAQHRVLDRHPAAIWSGDRGRTQLGEQLRSASLGWCANGLH